jgi:hypothetical protein
MRSALQQRFAIAFSPQRTIALSPSPTSKTLPGLVASHREEWAITSALAPSTLGLSSFSTDFVEVFVIFKSKGLMLVICSIFPYQLTVFQNWLAYPEKRDQVFGLG